PPMDPEPRPVQQPIPILVGGHSEAAIDRAARLGDGWIAANVSSDRVAELQPLLHAALERHGRSPAEVPLYWGPRPEDTSLDALRRCEGLGVRSVLVPLDSLDDVQRFADDVRPAFT